MFIWVIGARILDLSFNSFHLWLSIIFIVSIISRLTVSQRRILYLILVLETSLNLWKEWSLIMEIFIFFKLCVRTQCPFLFLARVLLYLDRLDLELTLMSLSAFLLCSVIYKFDCQSFYPRVQICYGTIMWYYAESLVSLGLYVFLLHALDSMVCLDDHLVIRGILNAFP